MPKSESYSQYKDYKENFQNVQSVRLINPNKSDMGRVSKQMLQEINDKLRDNLDVNQWKNTTDVLNWFQKIENKERATFLQFDIENYFPSITAELLEKALSWAGEQVEIKNQEKEIILSTKLNILYNEPSLG